MTKIKPKSCSKILWLAPNFNHYKARFLNHLANDKNVKLTIYSGTGRTNMGDAELVATWDFNWITSNVSKKDFGKSNQVKQKLKDVFTDFDWVLIPAEKKNLSLFLYALKLRKKYPSVRLFSYNHAALKSKSNLYKYIDITLSKFFYNNLDRVVFYTEDASNYAIQKGLVPKEKAYWANNTIDTKEVKAHYEFQLPPKKVQSILFIGRLIPSKRVGDVIKYFETLQTNLPTLKLEIIGDGPDNNIVKKAIAKNKNITWHGAVIDESIIAPIMLRNSLVFLPGLSGLSINHTFAYGRPYVTLQADKHGPEISYITHNENGLILNGSFKENTSKLLALLKNEEKLNAFCLSAKAKAEDLTVEKWVQQIKQSLVDG